jgi:hypothetical protein
MKFFKSAFCALFLLPGANAAIANTTDAEIQEAYQYTVAARGARRPDIAEDVLKGLIQKRPNAAQLRFDLGVALAEQNKCAAAARAFDNGKRMSNTPSFDRAVQSAMEDLCPGLAPLEVTLGFSVIHDTNANGGAGDSVVDVGGVPILLSSDAVAQAATGYLATASIAYNFRLSPTNYLVPSVGVAIADYQGSELDSYSITPGLAFRHQGDRIDWRVGPRAVYNYDSSGLVSSGGGIAGRASIMLGARSGIYIDASHLNIQDEDNDLRDYRQNAVSATFVHNPKGTKLSFRAGLSFTDRNYNDDFQDIKSTRLSLGLSGSLTPKIGYDLSYSHRISNGSVPHFMFGERKDNVDTFSASVSFAGLEGWYGRPYLGVSHSISDSTWETKTYDRTQIMMGFTRRF